MLPEKVGPLAALAAPLPTMVVGTEEEVAVAASAASAADAVAPDDLSSAAQLLASLASPPTYAWKGGNVRKKGNQIKGDGKYLIGEIGGTGGVDDFEENSLARGGGNSPVDAVSVYVVGEPAEERRREIFVPKLGRASHMGPLVGDTTYIGSSLSSSHPL